TLDPTEETLKPGVTAQVEIMVDTVDGKLAVPVQAIYTKGGQRYVFRDSTSGTNYAPVQLGAIGTEWAEVASGLSAGDRIRLAFSDEDKRAIPDASPGDKGNPMRTGRRSGPGGKTAQPPGGQAPAQGQQAAPAGRVGQGGGAASSGSSGQSTSGKKP
ncbi:MAG: efflux RND transporter periplasmic adaptor subunit, partial [Planctomycetota bacterium]